MIGWRARIGILVPPGNPTVEPETQALCPHGVSLHYTRLTATGEPGSLAGQEGRDRQQIESIAAATALLAMLGPQVVALAHTSTSYTLGTAGEAALVAQLEAAHPIRVVTAFAAVLAALRHLGATRIALGTPYSLATTLRGKAALEAHGIEVVHHAILPGVTNIYDETPERAYQLGRLVDHPRAQAVFLSGTGMPTLPALAPLETDLAKPVISATSAMMWHALSVAGVTPSPLAGPPHAL